MSITLPYSITQLCQICTHSHFAYKVKWDRVNCLRLFKAINRNRDLNSFLFDYKWNTLYQRITQSLTESISCFKPMINKLHFILITILQVLLFPISQRRKTKFRGLSKNQGHIVLMTGVKTEIHICVTLKSTYHCSFLPLYLQFLPGNFHSYWDVSDYWLWPLEF